MSGIGDKERIEYLLNNGWYEEWSGCQYTYVNPEHSRFEQYPLKEAYKMQRQIERNKDCGCG
jgi:hypothetical protein